MRVPAGLHLGAAARPVMRFRGRPANRSGFEPDLAALAPLGALNDETATLIQRVTGWTVAPYVFRSLPKFDWHAQLGHQTRALPPAADCLTRVRNSTRREVFLAIYWMR